MGAAEGGSAGEGAAVDVMADWATLVSDDCYVAWCTTALMTLLAVLSAAVILVTRLQRAPSAGPVESSFLRELRLAFEKKGLHDSVEGDADIKSVLRHLKLRPSQGLIDDFVKCCRRTTVERKCPDAISFGEFSIFVRQLELFRESFQLTPSDASVQMRISSTVAGAAGLSGAPAQGQRFQVFLGGSCNPTTWRKDRAIPKLKAADITYFNPQIDNWSPELIELEEEAKKAAQVKFFVIDKLTRGVSSMVEIAYLAASQCELMVVLEDFDEDAVFEGETVLPLELKDLNRGHDFLCTLLFEKGIPLFDDIETALDYTVRLVLEGKSIRHLRGNRYVAEPVIRSTDLSVLAEAHSTFDQYDSDNTGHLSVRDLQLAVRSLLSVYVERKDIAEVLDACSLLPDGTGARGYADKDGNARWVSRSDFMTVVACLLTTHDHQPGRVAPRRAVSWRSAGDAGKAMLDSSASRGVFLGGSVGENNRWREQSAVPILMRHGVDFFNPNLIEWSPQLTPREAQAKRSCSVLLYYIGADSRAISTMVEAAHFLGEGRDVVLCLETIAPGTVVDSERITARAAKDINRGRHYLADVANRMGAPVFKNIDEAVLKAVQMVEAKRAAAVAAAGGSAKAARRMQTFPQ